MSSGWILAIVLCWVLCPTFLLGVHLGRRQERQRLTAEFRALLEMREQLRQDRCRFSRAVREVKT